MKQIVQYFSSGETAIVEAPAPMAVPGSVVIRTSRSLISAGTERMLVGFGKASMLQKARQQPEKVRQVLGKITTDGLMATVDAVRSKLDQPIPLGYCNVGQVIEVGSGVLDFAVGDRVVSNGPHADIVRVPRLLCAHIPDGVSDDAAAFTVVASIGLQGVRLAAPTLGESVVVTGAGLLGLLTVQLLIAQGCRVLAIDYDESKLAIARQFGALTCNPGAGEDPVAAGMAFSRGRGVDAVIITASTDSNDPVTNAAQMSRQRGRIILVGVTGLKLNRSDFYEKELSFQVSCSYGPGRYDPNYEAAGNDYPFGFVRWTEQRNFEAVLDTMAAGKLDTAALITQWFDFENAGDAYASLTQDKSGLGLMLTYASPLQDRLNMRVALSAVTHSKGGKPVIGVIGAGNYASRVLIPAFSKAGAKLHTLASAGGLSSALHGRKAGFAAATSDVDGIFGDPAINAVVIATRHDSHALLASQALAASKHVFVEKPLGITSEDIDQVEAAYRKAHAAGSGVQLMVGFNRRFAPQIVKMKTLLDTIAEPKSFLMVMNAGAIDADHWTQDVAVGGGRIVGEACHHIDLMRYLAASPITSVSAHRMGEGGGIVVTEDKASITLGFADGSFGTIMYLANGSPKFPKERIEVFAAQRTLQIDNFRKMTGFGWPRFSSFNLRTQDKGQLHCTKRFLEAVSSGVPAIPVDDIFEVARITLRAVDQLRTQSS
jgi:predicted dehydrogenase/threonine dehydrogenase-like Zn-dependent dehydrogenase